MGISPKTKSNFASVATLALLATLKRFISKIHKYLDLQELTPTILNDMVKRVYVHAPQTIDGKRTQQIDICYDLVGILPMSLLNKNNETA